MKAQNAVTIQEAKDELKREQHVRSKCYPKWTEEGKLTRAEAAVRFDGMAAAIEFLDFIEVMEHSLSSFYTEYLIDTKLKSNK